MKITFVGRQMSVRDSLKAMVEKKLAKFDRFFREDAEATVKFGYVRDLDRLEITISADGTLYRCEKEASTFEIALDECMDAIERQMRKNKTRLERRLREGAFLADASAPQEDFTDVEEEGDFVIRTKEFTLKPMTPEEAILQMNLLGHSFFVFRDTLTEDVCVVYKRKDNQYGLIVPAK